MRRAKLGVLAISFALLTSSSAQAAFVAPASKDYGAAPIGTASAPQTFLLSSSTPPCPDPPNCFSSPVYFVDTSALGGGLPGTTTNIGNFSIHNIDCPNTALSTFGGVPATCNFEVSFVPATSGPISRTLSFAENTGSTATLSLTGTGVVVTTGQRSTAIKKCKKKFPKGTAKRKKCLKRARKLPL